MSDDFLRRSQVLTTFGPGAMVDLPEGAVLIGGMATWRYGEDGLEEVPEPRLVAKLRRQLNLPEVRLVKPPAFDERPGAKRASIGAILFPTWHIVQDARASGPGGTWRRRRLVRADELVNGRFRDDEAPHAAARGRGGRSRANLKVVPVRFVCGCPKGHLDELDWRVFAHRGAGPSCGRRMWLEERGTSGNIADVVVGCDCGIPPRPLYEALSHATRPLGTCKGRRPWLGPYTSEECDLPQRLLVRSASNAFFPRLVSAISLPEQDPGPAARLDAVWHILQAVDGPASLAAFRRIPDVVAALDGIGDQEVLGMIERRRARGAPPDDAPLKEAEFDLLDVPSGIRGKDDATSSFYAEALPRDVWDSGRSPALRHVARVILVHRLREVMALVGFTRFEAAGPDANGELDLGVAAAAVDVEPRWFPAIENRGEGIFVVVDPASVRAWLAREPVRERAAKLVRGCEVWVQERPGSARQWPGAAYVLLHSLSHLLLTRIALDCGYPAASLRERVYALPEKGRFGVLIYTGTPDADGTLGGLVAAGRRVGEHLADAVEAARLCSNDPVCAEHDPAGRHDAARLTCAACHGCLLVAETSCEQRNDWLDRALVVPTVATPGAAFFA